MLSRGRYVVVVLLAALAACSGGGSSSGSGSGGDTVDAPGTTGTATPQATAVGTPVAAAVSAVVDSSGGQLNSADGGLTVEVPAGAFSAPTTVSIQAISDEAPGGLGHAYRIEPEGLQTTVPMTLRFHYTDADMQGTAPRFTSIAYQDGEHYWRVYNAPTRDETAHTLAVATSHFSDWSSVVGVQLRPGAANVNTGAGIALQIQRCEQIEVEGENGGASIVSLLAECGPAPIEAFSAQSWAVNGVAGGSSESGVVVAASDKSTGTATYTAPQYTPAVNPVAVSVQVTDIDDASADVTLVSSIKVVQTLQCTSMRDIESFSVDVSFQPFNWSASGGNEAYEGHESGRITGTLVNRIPAPTRELTNYGYWSTAPESLGGWVSVDDTLQIFYDDHTETTHGLGAGVPYAQPDAPSQVSLIVNYDTCTYQLAAGFLTAGTVTTDGVSTPAPVPAGAVYYSEVLRADDIDNGVLTRAVVLPATYSAVDEEQAGFHPPGQDDLLRATGDTAVHWSIAVPQ